MYSILISNIFFFLKCFYASREQRMTFISTFFLLRKYAEHMISAGFKNI